jgi:hypothetical protein
MCGAALIAVATFLGFAYYGLAVMNRSSSDALRDAIAAAFVTVYLTIVGWSAFFNTLTDAERPQLAPLTQTVITNFTTLTGAVMAFYFTSAAAVRIIETRAAARSGAASSEPKEVTDAEQPDGTSPSAPEARS